VKKVYGDKVRIVWKNLPLSMHQNAGPAAIASMAAHDQGKFWEYHDMLFKNQGKLKKEDLLQHARELKLDMKRFEEAINAAKFKAAVDADASEADKLGVTGTPAFFVNGHFLSGAQPFEGFAKLINAELTKLGLPIPAGAASAGGL
jgi:protein-disulfide isomerase